MGIETVLCPECGSGKVEIAGTKCKCLACEWEGDESGLMKAVSETPVSDLAQGDTAQHIAFEVAESYMGLLYKKASPLIGMSAIESGIVARKDTKNLTRIIRAACLGAYKETLNELEAIAEEYTDKRSKIVS